MRIPTPSDNGVEKVAVADTFPLTVKIGFVCGVNPLEEEPSELTRSRVAWNPSRTNSTPAYICPWATSSRLSFAFNPATGPIVTILGMLKP